MTAAVLLRMTEPPARPSPPPSIAPTSGKLLLIALPTAQRLVAAGAVLVDVREEAEARGESIPGAQRWPISWLVKHLEPGAPRPELGTATAVIFFCTKGEHCSREEARLARLDLSVPAYRLDFGLDGWLRAGRPSFPSVLNRK
jgi:rhodanese-related sulfurtransferase